MRVHSKLEVPVDLLRSSMSDNEVLLRFLLLIQVSFLLLNRIEIAEHSTGLPPESPIAIINKEQRIRLDLFLRQDGNKVQRLSLVRQDPKIPIEPEAPVQPRGLDLLIIREIEDPVESADCFDIGLEIVEEEVLGDWGRHCIAD